MPVGSVQLAVYNLNGELVDWLFSGDQFAGSHQVIWDASGHPSGIYLVRLNTGDLVETQKVMLLK